MSSPLEDEIALDPVVDPGEIAAARERYRKVYGREMPLTPQEREALKRSRPV